MNHAQKFRVVGLFAGLSLASVASAQPKPWIQIFNPVLEESPVIKDLIQRSKGGSPRRSSLGNMLPLLPPVRNQLNRGTCSSFATLATIEVWLQKQGMSQEEADMSEEFQYLLAKTQVMPSSSGGSTDLANIGVLKRLGMMRESDLPYDGTDWHDLTSVEIQEKVKAECATFNGAPMPILNIGICQEAHGYLPQLNYFSFASLIGTPVALKYKAAAAMMQELKDRRISLSDLGSRRLLTEEGIKNAIDQGIPLYLRVEYFYGSWSSPRMKEYRIGKRDPEKYARGDITYPTPLDIKMTRKFGGGGHAVVLVGYDDFKEKFIFRNSWGTDTLGRDYVANVDGTSVPMPGYGEIDYSYVFDFGLASALTPIPN
jgi:hypothetical protein